MQSVLVRLIPPSGTPHQSLVNMPESSEYHVLNVYVRPSPFKTLLKAEVKHCVDFSLIFTKDVVRLTNDWTVLTPTCYDHLM